MHVWRIASRQVRLDIRCITLIDSCPSPRYSAILPYAFAIAKDIQVSHVATRDLHVLASACHWSSTTLDGDEECEFGREER